MKVPKFIITSCATHIDLSAIFIRDVQNILDDFDIEYVQIGGLFNFAIRSVNYFIDFECFNSVKECEFISSKRNVVTSCNIDFNAIIIGNDKMDCDYFYSVIELRKYIGSLVS